MNAADVTGLCTAVQYGLIMLTCGSRKLDFNMTENRLDGTLNYGQFGSVIGKQNHLMVFRRPLL